MSGDKKLVYSLVAIIIILEIILLIKIKTMPKYNPKIYEEIYDEYESIFGKEDDEYEFDEDAIQNMIDNNTIINENNTQMAYSGESNINNGKGNVIGKIIIPKIKVRCPILKETTTEYLKIAPTKYCGPEINEIRKSSYSRS